MALVLGLVWGPWFPWLEAASVEPAFCKFPGSRGAAVNDGKVFGLAF